MNERRSMVALLAAIAIGGGIMLWSLYPSAQVALLVESTQPSESAQHENTANEQTRDQANSERVASRSSSVPAALQRIAVQHATHDGWHYYFGSLRTPHTCDTLETRAATRKATSTDAAVATLYFSYRAAPNASCQQSSAARQFSFAVPADSSPDVSARVNGQPISLDITQAEEMPFATE